MTPKCSGSWQQAFIISVSMDQKSGHRLAVHLWLNVFHKVAVKPSPRATITPEGLTEVASNLQTHLFIVGRLRSQALGVSPQGASHHGSWVLQEWSVPHFRGVNNIWVSGGRDPWGTSEKPSKEKNPAFPSHSWMNYSVILNDGWHILHTSLSPFYFSLFFV